MDTKKLSSSLDIKDDKSNKVNTLLLTKEKQIALIKKSEPIYKPFLEQFKLYLTKLGHNTKLVKYVSHLYDLGGIYLGIGESLSNNELVFARILLSNNKLAGIVLNSEYFHIDLLTGETDSIDSCIYAVYFGMIRASVLCNAAKIKQDFKLHKLAITALYQIILRSLDKKINLNSMQLNGLMIGCGYLYLRHFLLKNHLVAISNLKKIFKDSMNPDSLNLYITKIDEKSAKLKSLQQIGSILLDLDIIQSNPNQVVMSMIALMGSKAFYNLISSLDHYIALLCLLNYQTDLYDIKKNIKSSINSTIEAYIDSTYLDELKYSILST